MNLTGRHSTRYTFASPVTLAMHSVRLRPRSDGSQFLRHFDIQISPHPSMQAEVLDAEGNGLVNVWFFGEADHLYIETCFEVETLRSNPFDFVPSPDAALPLTLSSEEALLLKPAIQGGNDPVVQSLAQDIVDQCSGSVMDYTGAVNRWIYEHIRYENREDGHPLFPAETLIRRAGACRDTAVLLMELCRAIGIPSRFVSGYQEGGPEVERHELHAWAEVWVPGGGWRGFDPTHGLAVADGHVAVAASADPRLAAPVSGGFYGNLSQANIPEHQIELSVG